MKMMTATGMKTTTIPIATMTELAAGRHCLIDCCCFFNKQKFAIPVSYLNRFLSSYLRVLFLEKQSSLCHPQSPSLGLSHTKGDFFLVLVDEAASASTRAFSSRSSLAIASLIVFIYLEYLCCAA